MPFVIYFASQLALGLLNLIGIEKGEYISDHFVAQIYRNLFKRKVGLVIFDNFIYIVIRTANQPHDLR